MYSSALVTMLLVLTKMAAPLSIDDLLFVNDNYPEEIFDIKFEMDRSSVFSDDDLLETVEAIESSQSVLKMPAPAIEADVSRQDPPAPDESNEEKENAAPTTERFATLGADEMEEILAGASSTHTNIMTKWGVHQFKRMPFLPQTKQKDPHNSPMFILYTHIHHKFTCKLVVTLIAA